MTLCFNLLGDKSEVLDIENPDYTRFPKFREVTRLEGQLLPGDVLYIPGKKVIFIHILIYLNFFIAYCMLKFVVLRYYSIIQ